MPEAQNLQYLRRWVRENRPQDIEKIEEIINKSIAYKRRAMTDPTGEAMLLMALIGIEAGRLLEQEHPTKES
jgi:hypothetical protein